jgi:uncharacterized protein (DUF427 family)
MALTYGSGPFGREPAGAFNVELRRRGLLYLEESSRWIRGRFAGETVVDSKRSKLLHESNHLPVHYFPRDDVRMDLLRPSEHSTHCPLKGDASYWSIAAGDRVAENAAWSYEDPIESAAALAGLVAFYWSSLDEWLEEEERAVGHARDPYHRIDVRQTSRHVRVSVHGETVADTRRARVLFEASLPPRWYIPEEDVRMEMLEPSDSQSVCAYKGFASYWHVRSGDRLEDDLVWTYRDPLHDAREVKDYLAFYNERVDLEVDAEPQERPRTQWSRD